MAMKIRSGKQGGLLIWMIIRKSYIPSRRIISPKKYVKKHKLGEYSEEETLEDWGGIKPIPMIDETETKSVSDERKAETKRRLQGRAAEYLMFSDD